MKDIDIDAAIRLADELPYGFEGDGTRIAVLVDAVRKADIHITSDDAVNLDFEEQKAMDLLIASEKIVRSWGSANAAELTAAIHVIQGFIVQRMLHRLNPAAWSDWSTK